MIPKSLTLDLYTHPEQHLSDLFGKDLAVQYLLDLLLLMSLSSFSSFKRPIILNELISINVEKMSLKIDLSFTKKSTKTCLKRPFFMA